MRYFMLAMCAGLAACATTSDKTDQADYPTSEEEAPYYDDYAGEPSPIPSRPRETPDNYYPGPPMVGSGAPAAGGSTNVTVTRDFLPFIDVAIDQEAANSQWGLPLEDLYTRIRIVTLDKQATDMDGVASGAYTEAPAQRNYKDESRGWFSRMMGSKEVSRALLAEFEISKPDVKATEALFSASFTSNREQGESWSTDQSLALYATPWFKVSSNTTITAKLRMQLSDERESSGATANVMSSLTNAASLLAPSSSLITAFTAPTMLEASNFLDNSVSTLFGRSITEQTMSSMAIKSWSDKPILVVFAALPDARDIRNTKDREMLGGWAVYLDAPIVSVFTSTTQPDEQGYDQWPDYRGVVGADILAFKIGEELTVYDYIFSRLDLFDRIASLNDYPDADLARLICTRMERGLAEMGFNAADSAAGVWAAATSDQFNAAASAAMLQPSTCTAMQRWFTLSGEVVEAPLAGNGDNEYGYDPDAPLSTESEPSSETEEY
ncbi:hypothetical protein WNY37_07195 [Henriciella sp. AS95]|uniref:hypothetical protein n=1 Tax=Henriciella sp. AS95 TaxID=3135782 RepID=UPI00316BA45B